MWPLCFIFFFFILLFYFSSTALAPPSSSPLHPFLFVFSVVGLDIQDEMGRHEVGHIDNSMKVPLNQGYGCRFEGEFTINKVRGPITGIFIRFRVPDPKLNVG